MITPDNWKALKQAKEAWQYNAKQRAGLIIAAAILLSMAYGALHNEPKPEMSPITIQPAATPKTTKPAHDQQQDAIARAVLASPGVSRW
jgi:hypothetical protein